MEIRLDTKLEMIAVKDVEFGMDAAGQFATGRVHFFFANEGPEITAQASVRLRDMSAADLSLALVRHALEHLRDVANLPDQDAAGLLEIGSTPYDPETDG